MVPNFTKPHSQQYKPEYSGEAPARTTHEARKSILQCVAAALHGHRLGSKAAVEDCQLCGNGGFTSS